MGCRLWPVGKGNRLQAVADAHRPFQADRRLSRPEISQARRLLTDDDLANIRKRRAELFRAWQELPPGRTLDLDFPDPD